MVLKYMVEKSLKLFGWSVESSGLIVIKEMAFLGANSGKIILEIFCTYYLSLFTSIIKILKKIVYFYNVLL